MNYARFLTFSVIGATLWITICTLAGYKLAKVEFISNHFDLVVVAIVIISVLPMVFEYLKHRRHARGAIPVATEA
jgi:membrane-associated protein